MQQITPCKLIKHKQNPTLSQTQLTEDGATDSKEKQAAVSGLGFQNDLKAAEAPREGGAQLLVAQKAAEKHREVLGTFFNYCTVENSAFPSCVLFCRKYISLYRFASPPLQLLSFVPGSTNSPFVSFCRCCQLMPNARVCKRALD